MPGIELYTGGIIRMLEPCGNILHCAKLRQGKDNKLWGENLKLYIQPSNHYLMKKYLDFFKDYSPVLITLISGYSYLCAYVYEWGYIEHFNIANGYISIDLSILLKFASYAIVITFSVLLVTAAILVTPLSKSYKSTWLLRIIALVIIYNLASVYFFRESFEWYYIVQDVAVIMIIVYTAESKAKKVRKEFYKINVRLQDPIPRQKFDRIFPIEFYIVEQLFRIRYIVFVLFIAAMYFCYYSYVAGNRQAEQQVTFSVMKSKPWMCLIRTYSGNYYFKNYDSKKNTFGDTLKVLKDDGSGGVELYDTTFAPLVKRLQIEQLHK